MSDQQYSDRGDGRAPADQAAEGLGPDQAQLIEELRQQLGRIPAAQVVTEVAVQLVNMATIRLGLPPEQHGEFRDLDQARLLTDALAGLLDATTGRIGPAERQLRDALAQLRLIWVRVADQGDASGARAGGEQEAAGSGQRAPGAGQGEGQASSRLTTPPSGLWIPGRD